MDARLTRQMSVGMKTYVRELVRRLPAAAPDLRLVVFSNEALDVPPPARFVRVDPMLAVNASVGEQIGLPMLMRRHRAALAHFMSLYAPRFPGLPYVYTIHDLIHLRFPEYSSWKIPLYYRWLVGPDARNADAVLVDSGATKYDVAAFLAVDASRVRVTPLGVRETFILDEEERARRGARARQRFGLENPYVFYAGNHRKHKNVDTLVAAWRALADPCDLALTEDRRFPFETDRYEKAGGRIVRLGHVGDDELIDLYAGCAATVQPSLFEGFGLSVLEGMAAGAPVLVAQTPALLEVAGDAAATFSPLDAGSLSALLHEVLTDEARATELRRRGRARARQFSWDETARRTVDAYREVLR